MLKKSNLDSEFNYFPKTCSFNTFSKSDKIKVGEKEISFESLFDQNCKGKESCKLRIPT